MELSFILVACRRFWWLVVLTTLMGCGAGVLAAQRGEATFQAEALVNVSPPSGDFQQPDRYIAGQLVLFNSAELTATVADAVGVSPAEVRASRLFNQVIGSNVVRIQVDTTDAELSAAIADAYVDAYFDEARERLDEVVEPQIADLDRALAIVDAELALLNQQVTVLLDEFNDRGLDAPPIDQLDAQLASDRIAALERRADLIARKSELELGADARLTSRVLQRPEVPTELTSPTSPLLPIAGFVLGAMLGVALAAVLAHRSKRVLNDAEAERILGLPFVGELSLSDTPGPNSALLEMEGPLPPAIQRVNVRVLASKPPNAPVSILVAGVQPKSGVSAISALITANFAHRSRDTVLVDANGEHPDLTDSVEVAPPTRRPTDAARRVEQIDRVLADRAASTPVEHVRFLGLDLTAPLDPQLLRISEGINADQRIASVEVVDGGALTSSVSTLHLARRVDGIVLVVPSNARTEALQSVADELRRLPDVVVTPLKVSGSRKMTSRRGRRRSASSEPAVAA